MCRGAFKVALASAMFFAVHSALANDWAKAQAAHLFGHRAADAWYRPFYLVQGLLLLGLLALYIRRQPGRDLYEAKGGWPGLNRVIRGNPATGGLPYFCRRASLNVLCRG